MPTGPGGLDSNGIWQFGEDDSEALASDLLNLGMGSVSTAITNLEPVGVLQVVSTTKTGTQSGVVVKEGTLTVSGLAPAITASSATNKILVQGTVSIGNDSGLITYVTLLKNGSPLAGAINSNPSSRRAATSGGGHHSGGSIVPASFSFLDTAGNTTSNSYEVTVAHNSSASRTMHVNRPAVQGNDLTDGQYISTITLSEVAG